MGRFLWNQGHPKHSESKARGVAHEWFSKEQAEPSREALNNLMKEQPSFESSNVDLSFEARTRSRTNTVTSSFSVSARSLSDASNDLASRPSSQQSFVDSGMPLPERHESTARNLLARGTRILKRQGSKLNLLPSQMEERSIDLQGARGGELSPGKSVQRQPTLSSKGKHSLFSHISSRLTVSRSESEAKYFWPICIPAFDARRPGPLPESGLGEQDRSILRVQCHSI
jgi:hypothetical protein